MNQLLLLLRSWQRCYFGYFSQSYERPLAGKMALRLGIIIILSILSKGLVAEDEEDVFHPSAKVWTITPDRISTEGGVITIYGRDFAQNNFNQFEPDLGNKVS